MDSKTKEQLDRQNSKLKTNETHHLKWVKIKDITSEVTSINSRINQAVSKEFINFLSHNS